MDLKELRNEIDSIDSRLIELFCERMEISRKIGDYKKKNNLPVLDKERERAKIEDIKSKCPEDCRAAAAELYEKIFSLSRNAQTIHCGLLGEKLSHSYSPRIHKELGDYEYLLYEKSPRELEDFILNGCWDGLNVTIPYKKTLMAYCTELSPRAAEIGSVNTLIKRKDGSIYGDNTDAFGFELLVKKLPIDPKGKKALVLGSGGASRAVIRVLKELGAGEIKIISRTGEDNYENLSRNYDAEIIVNTTPLGTYPNNGSQAVDLSYFKNCKAVFDLVYNPARTALIMQAESLCIPCAGGLYMLVGQAKRSAELFSGKTIDDIKIQEIFNMLSGEMENIALIGMPGCGKSSVGEEISKITGRAFYDIDALIEEKIQMSIPEFFKSYGEAAFRKIETETLEEISKLSGSVISCGGGIVTKEENYKLLHQNSKIVWLKRELSKLPIEGRPVSQSRKISDIYRERQGLYRAFSDFSVENKLSIEAAAKEVLEALK